jgi:multidrug resistance efflux pump
MAYLLRRAGVLVAVTAVLAGAIALAQERKPIPVRRDDGILVFNPIPGKLAVIDFRRDGTRVDKGEVVCELDGGELKDRLVREHILLSSANSGLASAKLDREVARINVDEYQQGIFVQDLATVEGEIKLAEADLARGEDRVDWVRRMYDKGYASLAERVTQELGLKKAQFALELAQGKKKVLVNYTKARTVKALQSALESARAKELARQADVEREQSACKRLADQIDRCKVTAPAAGRVQFATPMGRGALVGEGQMIFRLIPEVGPGPATK